MQGVSQLAAILLGRWTMSFAGVAIAMMLVWYLGPLVPGGTQPLTRALLILAIVLVWAGVNGVMSWRRRRRERTLAVAVTEGAVQGRDARADAAEEVARLRERMQAALQRLRGNRRRGYLYEQPWFVLIGPPGSGKTTALLNSGLNFPLAREDGSDAAVGGVGGTRLCDWWFADEAVLIDTAGRYTTQDSDAAVDRAGWEGFLDLLRRTRPRQPINGVIVIISLVDIAAADPAERAAHARTVRRRVTEISDKLRLRVPVYVVFSKADRLTGFNEYFDDLDAEARAQVWGMTFPLSRGVEVFDSEFRLLVDRLSERLFERLQAERAPDRRALLSGFPLQIASLAEPLAAFLTQAFGGTKLDPAPFLRGVYMSSATQEGTPIDQLTGMLARAFGVDQKRTPSLRPVAGRSYFLRRLVAEVVLGEALLVSTNSSRQRRRYWLRIAGFAAIGLTTIIGAAALWRIEAANRSAVTQANVALAAYRSQLAGMTLDPISNDDLTRIAPLLDAAAALPRGQGLWLTAIPGLSQSEKLTQSDRLIYRNVLQQILLPRLVWRLEAQMRARFGDPDFLYEATRVYLMLGGAGPLDRTLVRNWEMLDWQARFPGALNQPLRDRLAAHLDALLNEPLPAVTLDGGLVSGARATFSRVPLAQRVYGRIKGDAAADGVPDWTPADALGPAGAQLFTRPSGKALTEGIPGFYTSDGFRKILLGRLAATARSVAGESWVLGHTEEIPSDGPAVEALEHVVVALYVTDLEKQWDTLLDDIALVSLGDHDSVVQRLYVLSSPQSPMRDLLLAIAHALNLQPPAPPAGAQQPAAQDKRLAAVVAGSASAQDPYGTPANAALAQHYGGLLALVGDGQGASPLSGVLQLVNRLQAELAQTGPAAANASAALQAGGDPVTLLLAEAQRQSMPMSRWLRQIADGGRVALTGNVQAATAAAFSANAGPGELCRSVVAGHYPFDSTSGNDAPLDDFARLFAPNGALDSFFQTQIRPWVDMSGSVWRVRSVGGVAPPVDAATVARFQRAEAIRDAFFPTGGAEPQLRFTVGPVSLDPGSKQATLTLAGATIADNGKDAPATSLSWPANGGTAQAGLVFDPAASTPLTADGSWALFRLLGDGHLVPDGGSGAFRLNFSVGTQQASFRLEAASSRSPFGRSLLEGFQCPAIR
ncbi:MAG: type secretion system protein ImpL [Acetobacteraceae bacterium]|nr:type secretion system protein ImpL [Acetobacteraceae bacterium]